MKRAVLSFALVALFLAACSPDPGWVSRVEEAHRAADAAAARGDFDGARAALSAVSEQGLPMGVAAADRRRVQQDLFFRRAAFALQSGDAEGAQRLATEGLALGAGDDSFSVNLWVVRGRARERLALTEQSAEDYHRALLANEALLSRALDEPEGSNQPGDPE